MLPTCYHHSSFQSQREQNPSGRDEIFKNS
jgi:hypothetical protein